MSDQFTRCPQCRTTFRVTAPQLALRDGQVRCGRCRAVFNAFGSMVNVRGERIPGPGMEGTQHETMTLRDFILEQDNESFSIITRPISAMLPGAPINPPAPETQITHVQIQAPAHSPVADGAAAASATNAANGNNTDDAPAAPEKSARRRRRRTGASPLALVLDTERPTIWQKLRLPRWCRPVFYAVALPGFALLLAGQATYFFHDPLASQYPQWKSALTSGCEWLGCRVLPVQNRDALSIEASDLQRIPNLTGHLLLSATLRNRGTRPVAYPALQLELTDTQGRLQSRRYLAPEEYLVEPRRTDDGLAASSDLALRLLLRTPLDINGYRLSLDYPPPAP